MILIAQRKLVQLRGKLWALEKALQPRERIILIYSRDGVEEKDYQKQVDEYSRLYGGMENVTFLVIRDYYDPFAPYDVFIKAKREAEAQNNSFCGWWRV
jgi:hypothetical protein